MEKTGQELVAAPIRNKVLRYSIYACCAFLGAASYFPQITPLAIEFRWLIFALSVLFCCEAYSRNSPTAFAFVFLNAYLFNPICPLVWQFGSWRMLCGGAAFTLFAMSHFLLTGSERTVSGLRWFASFGVLSILIVFGGWFTPRSVHSTESSAGGELYRDGKTEQAIQADIEVGKKVGGINSFVWPAKDFIDEVQSTAEYALSKSDLVGAERLLFVEKEIAEKKNCETPPEYDLVAAKIAASNCQLVDSDQHLEEYKRRNPDGDSVVQDCIAVYLLQKDVKKAMLYVAPIVQQAQETFENELGTTKKLPWRDERKLKSLCRNTVSMAALLDSQGKMQEAEDLLSKSMTIVEFHGCHEQLLDLAKTLTSHYEKTGNYKEALAISKQLPEWEKLAKEEEESEAISDD